MTSDIIINYIIKLYLIYLIFNNYIIKSCENETKTRERFLAIPIDYNWNHRVKITTQFSKTTIVIILYRFVHSFGVKIR